MPARKFSYSLLSASAWRASFASTGLCTSRLGKVKKGAWSPQEPSEEVETQDSPERRCSLKKHQVSGLPRPDNIFLLRSKEPGSLNSMLTWLFEQSPYFFGSEMIWCWFIEKPVSCFCPGVKNGWCLGILKILNQLCSTEIASLKVELLFNEPCGIPASQVAVLSHSIPAVYLSKCGCLRHC